MSKEVGVSLFFILTLSSHHSIQYDEVPDKDDLMGMEDNARKNILS